MDRPEAEAALLAEWRATYPADAPFCDDGMVDAASYATALLRVAVVLRETNGTDAASGVVSGFDVRRYLRGGPQFQTYTKVARWVWGVQRGFPSRSALAAAPPGDLRAAIRGAAVINLKKLAGGPRADIDAVAAAAQRDHGFLRRQLSLLDPRVVIAGGTSENALVLMGVHMTKSVQVPDSYLVNGILVLGLDHPSARSGLQTYERVRGTDAVLRWSETRDVTLKP